MRFYALQTTMKPVNHPPLSNPAYHPPPLQKTPNSQEAEITKLESDFKTFVEGLQKQYQERAETSEFVG